jgi:DNA-3-methyladenine glycosylase I
MNAPPDARCTWPGTDPLYCAYHDTEWGVPEHDSRALWEKLMLDGFQAGLSWITILRKREALRAAFEGFDPARVAQFTETDITRLLGNPGIIRSRAKIDSCIGGARAYLRMQESGEDFAAFCWSFTQGKTIQNAWTRRAELPAQTPLSAEISKALKARGFKFVGPVIVYAWMQAVGIVNDHVTNCARYKDLQVAVGVR